MVYFRKFMEFDQKTIDFYNLQSFEYSSWSSKHRKDDILIKFISMLPEKSKILDLGCGAGHDSLYFVSKEFSVTALDASQKILETIPKHPNIEIINSDFISFKNKKNFSGIWSSFSLQHIKKIYLLSTVQFLEKHLLQQGIFYIGIHEGNKELRDSLGRYYCYYEEVEILDYLDKAGFKLINFSRDKSKSYDGDDINIMHLFLQKK
tara:strand:+ start:4911 stop:5528 length:618 start_codon:yes stop_codon:yes gene_type:complete